MSKEVSYRIISVSSEQKQHPVKSLLDKQNKTGWASQRFCTYPQQITLQFEDLGIVRELSIVVDHVKTPSMMDLLYFDPLNSEKQNKFTKFGTVAFAKNENTFSYEKKVIKMNIRCLYIRLLFWKPHPKVKNKFSQIQVHGLNLVCIRSSLEKMPKITQKNTKAQIFQEDFQDSEYIKNKIRYIEAKKMYAIKTEDFQQAQRLKLVVQCVFTFGTRLQALQKKKIWAAQNQHFQIAQQVKDNIEEMKKTMDVLIDQTVEGRQTIVQQYQIENKSDNIQQFHDQTSLKQKENLQNQRQPDQKSETNQSKTLNNSNTRNVKNFDEEIIPTLKKKLQLQNYQNQFQQQEQQQ